MSFDTHELRDLEVDLGRAPKRIREPRGLKRASRVVEREFKIEAAGHYGSFFTPRKRYKRPIDLPRYVSSELTGPESAVIGIEARGAGNVGHFVFYGTPTQAPSASTKAVVDRAMPGVLNDLADHAEESVLGRRGK